MTANPLSSVVKQFFAEYERASNTFEVERIVSHYSDVFLAAGPDGVQVGTNDERFRAAIPQRAAFMRSIGFKSARISSLDETWLDDHYVMVNVRWQMLFEKGGEAIEARFPFSYFLYVRDGAAKVVFYISHDDEQQAMQELGLLPPA